MEPSIERRDAGNGLIVATKLHVPRPRAGSVSRPRLLERLEAGMGGKLVLVSAGAGFGKTTLLGEWIASSRRAVAWVSLDPDDGEPSRFLAYAISALQTAVPGFGADVLALLQSSQPPSPESLLPAFVNETAALEADVVLALDDYHLLESPAVDGALAFVIERMGPRMRVVVSTREDPSLPLAKLRSRGELTELRAADLRCTLEETSAFLNGAMGLSLSGASVGTLGERTEGWIAGLQLAALSLRERGDASRLIESLDGSHRHILDYLLEEVLERQPAEIQGFLLRTSLLDRMCAPLCDALLAGTGGMTAEGARETLERMERANLFVVPLDDGRTWYRYHHLFGDLLRRRLPRSEDPRALYLRASEWSEANGQELDAFSYAAKAGDIDRAMRVLHGSGLPLHFRGGASVVIHWISSLPKNELERRPALSVAYCMALLFVGRVAGIEESLADAERAIAAARETAETRDLTGQIAGIRATLAVTRQDPSRIIGETTRALECLSESNVAYRVASVWALAFARALLGERERAKKAYAEALEAASRIGHPMIILLSTLGLAELQVQDLRLDAAIESFGSALAMSTNPLQTTACMAYMGLARAHYERNDLARSRECGEKAHELARLIENTDRSAVSEIFLAHLALTQGDFPAAAALLENAEEDAALHGYETVMPALAELRVRLFLTQGKVAAAASAPNLDAVPVAKARALVAAGDATGAVEILEPLKKDAEERDWRDASLKASISLSLAYHAAGDAEKGFRELDAALDVAEGAGCVRSFVDEGPAMARLLADRAKAGASRAYETKLLAAFATARADGASRAGSGSPSKAGDTLVEPLSPREIDVLRLIAEGLSNQEISDRLFVALSTVKGHNLNIFGKLQVQRRTEAVARARDLGLL